VIELYWLGARDMMVAPIKHVRLLWSRRKAFSSLSVAMYSAAAGTHPFRERDCEWAQLTDTSHAPSSR